MPDLVYHVDEIEAHGKHTVNKSGYLYVGQKYHNKGELVWIKLKDKKNE